MTFLEYIKKNQNGLTLIDEIRYTIQSICYKSIKDEYGNEISKADIDKLTMLIECNFYDSITKDSEWDLNTITFEEVKILVNTIVGFHNLCGGLDKIKRESYTEILWDVLYNLYSDICEDDEILSSSKLIEEISDAINNIECDETGYNYYMYSDEKLNKCITEIYKYYLQNKLDD